MRKDILLKRSIIVKQQHEIVKFGLHVIGQHPKPKTSCIIAEELRIGPKAQRN